MSDQPPYPNGPVPPGQRPPGPYPQQPPGPMPHQPGPPPQPGPYAGPPPMRPPGPQQPPPGYGPAPGAGPVGAGPVGAGPGPGQYGPPPGGVDYLSGPTPPPRRRRRGLIVTAAAVVAALAVSGGAYAIVSAAGGDDADAAVDELPATSIAAAWATLHPGGGTEKTTLRILHELDEDIPASGSLRDNLMSRTLTDPDLDYDKDLKPWLGDHVAAAAVPDGDQLQPIVAIEVTDKDKARKYLDTKQDTGYVFDGDYVVIAETREWAQQQAKAAGTDDLNKNAKYTAARKSLDGKPLAVAWADLDALKPYAKRDGQEIPSWAPSGVVAGLQFKDSYVDTQIKVTGGPKLGVAKMGPRIGKLPSDTTMAIGATGVDKGVRMLAQLMEDSPAGGMAMAPLLNLGDRTGIEDRDQVAALFGSRTILATGPGLSTVGMITKSDDPAKTKEQLDKLGERLSQGRDFTAKATDEGTVFASSPSYADKLAAQDGDLGGQSSYRTAVPDAESANLVIYANLDAFADVGGSQLPPQLENYRSFGLTCSFSATGAADIRMRLVVK